LQDALATKEPSKFLHAVLEESGYMAMLKDRNTPEDVARLENLEELSSALAEGMEAGETFTDFLDAAALVSDADQFEGKPGVTLITLHSTKGLEFDHVFLTGMEEGICPHSRSISEEKGIEEERRLVYVGMTRARQSLTLTRAVYRRIFGNEQQLRASLPSRFLAEIPSELVDTVRGSMAEIGETRSAPPAGPDFLRTHRRKTQRRFQSHAGAQSPPSELWSRNYCRRRGRRRRPPRIREFPRTRYEEVYRAVRATRTGINRRPSRLRGGPSRGTLRRVHS